MPNQGHTLGSLLREALFEHGASFAACVVPHPQDRFLRIVVDADNPTQVVLDAIMALRAELQEYKRTIGAYRAHRDALA